MYTQGCAAKARRLGGDVHAELTSVQLLEVAQRDGLETSCVQ